MRAGKRYWALGIGALADSAYCYGQYTAVAQYRHQWLLPLSTVLRDLSQSLV